MYCTGCQRWYNNTGRSKYEIRHFCQRELVDMKVVLPSALAAAVLLSSAQLGVDGVSLRGESSSLGALSLDLAAVTVPPPPTVSVQPVTQGPMTTTTTFHPTTPSATFDDPTTPSATFDDPTTPLPHSWTTAHASTTSAAPTTTKQGIFGSISRIFFKKKPKKATVEGLNAKLRILREKIEESKTQMKSAHEEGRKRVEALVTIADKEVQMLHQKGTEIDKRSAANFRKLKEVMLEEIKDARNKVKKEQEANKKYLKDFKVRNYLLSPLLSSSELIEIRVHANTAFGPSESRCCRARQGPQGNE